MQTKDPHLTKTPINTEAPNTEAVNTETGTEDRRVASETQDDKGTETLKQDVYKSKHVNDGDNPARQPDRRDQEGETPFDGNVNANTVSKADEQPQSDEITDQNRYATVDNAQTRVLNEDLK